MAKNSQFVQSSHDKNAEIVGSTTPQRDERFRREEIVERAFEQLDLFGVVLESDSSRAS
jgi:hypothetical protein